MTDIRACVEVTEKFGLTIYTSNQVKYSKIKVIFFPSSAIIKRQRNDKNNLISDLITPKAH